MCVFSPHAALNIHLSRLLISIHTRIQHWLTYCPKSAENLGHTRTYAVLIFVWTLELRHGPFLSRSQKILFPSKFCSEIEQSVAVHNEYPLTESENSVRAIRQPYMPCRVLGLWCLTPSSLRGFSRGSKPWKSHVNHWKYMEAFIDTWSSTRNDVRLLISILGKMLNAFPDLRWRALPLVVPVRTSPLSHGPPPSFFPFLFISAFPNHPHLCSLSPVPMSSLLLRLSLNMCEAPG